jgi:hypothetical protein
LRQKLKKKCTIKKWVELKKRVSFSLAGEPQDGGQLVLFTCPLARRGWRLPTTPGAPKMAAS